jgi:hypothetical protein
MTGSNNLQSSSDSFFFDKCSKHPGPSNLKNSSHAIMLNDSMITNELGRMWS